MRSDFRHAFCVFYRDVYLTKRVNGETMTGLRRRFRMQSAGKMVILHSTFADIHFPPAAGLKRSVFLRRCVELIIP